MRPRGRVLVFLIAMNVDKITSSVYYAGVNDRTTTLFESLWPLPQGVSYNSYIVKGSEKTALIEGTHSSFADRMIDHLLEVNSGKAPDYLVVNHMEPDHSGAVAELLRAFPELVIVGNAKTADMLRGYCRVGDSSMVIVKDGDTLSLGDKELKFILTPMLHWPETMMTWLESDGVLFSGDAFGCFGALGGGVVDTATATDRFFPEMVRYYSNIVAKYGSFVTKALAKTSGLDISYICPTHGPVWHDEIPRVVSLYDRMARWEPVENDAVLIVYGSMYGNTARLAERFASRLAGRGVKNIVVRNVAVTPLSDLLADVMRCGRIAIASPTYNAEIFPPVEAFVRAIVQRGVKNRRVALLGSFTWGPMACKKMATLLAEAGLDIAEAKPEMRQAMIDDVDTALDALAAEF